MQQTDRSAGTERTELKRAPERESRTDRTRTPDEVPFAALAALREGASLSALPPEQMTALSHAIGNAALSELAARRGRDRAAMEGRALPWGRAGPSAGTGPAPPGPVPLGPAPLELAELREAEAEAPPAPDFGGPDSGAALEL